jgi:hypothetical protein
MRDFFAPMYELFTSFYGDELGRHLYGWDGSGYNDPSLYISVGIYMLISSVLLAILFYVILNKPNFSRWYHWLLILLVNFVISWFLGFWLPYLDYDTGNIAADIVPYISTNDIVMFGLVNGILSIFWFSISSFLCRVLSKIVPSIAYNTRDTPFPR